MARLPSSIAAALVSLAAVEISAWCWMHPKVAGCYGLVLDYRPEKGNHEPGTGIRGTANNEQGKPEPSTSSDQQSSVAAKPAPDFTFTALPELYSKTAPMLRCSSGQVFRVDSDDSVVLYCAFLKWDGSDTGSVLEAFRHMPEVCMGSIGMALIEKAPVRSYRVGDQTISFDHSVFRDSRQGRGLVAMNAIVHTFRAVWVSGLSSDDSRQGLASYDFDQLRAIRINTALARFRPSHARVIQGAVRGAANGDVAWETFEQAMLKDLKFER